MGARVCASRPRVGKGRSRAEPAPRGPLFPAAPLRSAGLRLCSLQEAESRDPGPGVRAGLSARARPPLSVSPGAGGAERGGRRVRTGLWGDPGRKLGDVRLATLGSPRPQPGGASRCGETRARGQGVSASGLGSPGALRARRRVRKAKLGRPEARAWRTERSGS